MTLPTIRTRIEALEALLAEAAASEAHNADTHYAVTLGELNELRAAEAALVEQEKAA
jgi:hypothetical protein